ncbi:MAG: BMP family ABC transporter substrate-binding protein [Armatimonadota bacterium]|nr:BMP family ABC transporter substrate-binding protein [Armatimonadota bacterium]MDR7484764.1 BMP family ABC transporter substrate-binding protein [Armatimonadota bacterium]MDR7531879.1 BMP family ABC transporter substrate-binding protein [Armatimonadota bacterium]MDR7534776.1 BMP family ABC transporter substrate-binding protein [Armatimonadota bacterium]
MRQAMVWLGVGLVAVLLAGSAAPLLAQAKPRVAFIYVGPVGDAGWTFQHDQARRHLAGTLGADTKFVESVPETAEVARVMEQFIRQGYKIIFATAFGYQTFALEVARKHADVRIIGIGPAIGLAPNVKTIYGRIWEGRYLTGLVAGKMTRTNVVGFVAAHPITTVVAGVNAFALGVWETNPNAKVKVVWTRTWYDPPKEKAAAKTLLDAGADVIGQHQDTPSALQAAAESGKYGVGSESNMQRFAPQAYLTGTIWDWREVDAAIVRGIVAGQFKSEDYYGGLVDRMVSLGPLHASVPADVRTLLEQRRRAIIDGSFQIFRGPLADQGGRERVPAGRAMTLKEILTFDWLLKGVEGQAPTAK